MLLILIINLLAVSGVCGVSFLRGFEKALPVTAFLMVLLPNESQIPLPGLFDLTTQRILVIVLFVLYLFNSTKGAEKHAPPPLIYLALLPAVWMLVSCANSVVPTISFKTVLSQSFDFYVPFYIYSRSITKVSTVQRILYAMLLAVVVCSVFGAIEAYRGWSVISWFPPTTHRFGGDNLTAVTDRGIRVQSTFGHPILFGSALALAIPLVLYFLILSKTRTQKAFLWLSMMLMFLDIYKTSSRGPWLALIFSLFALLVFSRNKVRGYLLAVCILTVSVLVIRPGVWESIENIYSATQDPESPQGSSYEWRYALYRVAFERLNKDLGRAVWGYGPESFYYLGWEGTFQGRIVQYDSCDSSVAEIMIETGYVGLLFFAALLLGAITITYRNFRSIPEPLNYLCLVLLVNLCAFAFLMTNVALLGWGQQTYMFWVILALAMIYPRLIAEGGESGNKIAAGLITPVSHRCTLEARI